MFVPIFGGENNILNLHLYAKVKDGRTPFQRLNEWVERVKSGGLIQTCKLRNYWYSACANETYRKEAYSPLDSECSAIEIFASEMHLLDWFGWTVVNYSYCWQRHPAVQWMSGLWQLRASDSAVLSLHWGRAAFAIPPCRDVSIDGTMHISDKMEKVK